MGRPLRVAGGRGAGHREQERGGRSGQTRSRCYWSAPLGKRNLQGGSAVGRPDPEGLGAGEPGHGNPGQKDRGRGEREWGDSGSSRDRSSTRCHFSWTCCSRASGGLTEAPPSTSRPGRGEAVSSPAAAQPPPTQAPPHREAPPQPEATPLQSPRHVRGPSFFDSAPREATLRKAQSTPPERSSRVPSRPALRPRPCSC